MLNYTGEQYTEFVNWLNNTIINNNIQCNMHPVSYYATEYQNMISGYDGTIFGDHIEVNLDDLSNYSNWRVTQEHVDYLNLLRIATLYNDYINNTIQGIKENESHKYITGFHVQYCTDIVAHYYNENNLQIPNDPKENSPVDTVREYLHNRDNG